ncbi:MAG TPA: membrane protein insertase YidC [Dongiaceae bacterium]
MQNNKNLILFIAISAAIFLGWQFFYIVPHQRQQALQHQQEAAQQATQTPGTANQGTSGSAAPASTAPTQVIKTREEALAESPRVSIDTQRLSGSIALKGGRLDDLVLKDYRETVDPNSSQVVLLAPSGTAHAYFSEVGFTTADAGVKVPASDTVWQTSDKMLSSSHPVTLTWDNGAGLIFKRVFAVDDNYMFTVTQSVDNKGTTSVKLVPYARVRRVGTPLNVSQSYVLFEGLIGRVGDTVTEEKYSGLRSEAEKGDAPTTVDSQGTGGWLGVSDKYWLVTQIAPKTESISTHFFYQQQDDSYQADYTGQSHEVAPGARLSLESRTFAGAKVVSLLRDYADNLQITHFERAVDFGYFWFFTEPLQWFLDKVYHTIGNFGIAILCLTVLVKLAMFPLANKSYTSMSKMKTLQPHMTALKEKYGDDKAKIQQEMMALYKREKVNPAAGCLPMFVQIPVFYSLYKVFYVTIEMRHAPFFGWIKDLSEKDPTTALNLFGLIPWNPDLYLHVPMIGGLIGYLSIGVWPLVMGLTMFLQMRLNPTPPDPVQAKMFMIMPFFFTFMLGHFAAGLVIYWAWNNTLSILQQRFIMWKLEKAKQLKKA